MQAALPHLAQRGSITLVSAASAGGSMPTTAALAAATPVGRVGTADDVAQAIVLRVDGGARSGAPK
ncbi:hypothetical protein ABZ511_18245 [Nocardia gamkensis]|uniref:hypothetical protein n=1 Tax=Nocardia gamkensis TaxID=352869 RepID=UPI0033FC914E